MEVAIVAVCIVALAALALVAFAIREFKTHVHSLVAAAFDRLQAKTLGEVAATEHARAMNDVAVRNLQDALAAKTAPAPAPATKRKLTTVTGETYSEDELEAL